MKFKVLTVLITLAASSAHASSFRCEASFAGKPASSLDGFLIETADLFPHSQKYLMRASLASDAGIKVRIGRFGVVQTFEDSIDLSNAKIEGLQTRETMWPSEGHSLELQIRENATKNDIWKVPLASEMDAVGFMIATKLNLKSQLHEDFRAGGFVIEAGVSEGSRSNLPSEMTLGKEFRIVGLTTQRIRLQDDSVLVLRVVDVRTNEVHEIQAMNRKALQVAKLLVQKDEVTVALRGNIFSLKEVVRK